MTEPISLVPKSSTFPLALSPDGGPVKIIWVEKLFARLSAILGGSMSNVYASADPELVKAEWAEAIGGFTADEIQRGLAACRTRKFAPNLGEFLHLCRPALDPEIGFNEAQRGLAAHRDGIAFAWSHPAVYWAAAGMAYEVRSTAYAHVKKRWDAHLADQFAVGTWGPVPNPTAKRLQQSAPPVADKARVDAIVSGLRRKLTGYSTKAEQEEALRRAEEQALATPAGEA